MDDVFESIGGDDELARELVDLLGLDPTGSLESTSALESVIGDEGLEAIIRKTGRPSLLIWRDMFEEARLVLWRNRLAQATDTLRSIIRATGRVELKGRTDRHLGTAWLIEEGIAVTNRHVAAAFTRTRNGVSTLLPDRNGAPMRVAVDFLSERDNPSSKEVAVAEVIWVANKFAGEPDVAFLRLDGDSGNLPDPAPLGDDTELQQHNPDDAVATIGYPAFDSRNDAADQQRIFDGIYQVKRLAPGLVQELRPDTIAHDCTTLGGNSGSPVASLSQGGVVGLHYSGSEGDENRAVRVSVVRRLLDRALGRDDPRRIIAAGAALGAARRAAAAPDGADSTEAPRPDLVGRVGYVADEFLADGISVPAPEPLDDVLTPLLDDAEVGDDPFELRYHHFSSWMHRDRRLPMFTAANLDGTLITGVKNKHGRWFLDRRIPEEAQIGEELYSGNALDRGHMVRRIDPAWGDLAEAAVVDTFHFTNCVPQHESLNRREWVALENHILSNVATHGFKASVFTGPIFGGDDPEYRDVLLPQAFWKIVVTLHTPEELDSEPTVASSGYVLSQEELITDLEFAFGQFRTFQVPIDRIRKWANLRLDDAILDGDAMVTRDTEGLGYRTIWTPEDALL